MPYSKFSSVVLMLIIAFSSSVFAQVPPHISYQGRLTDNGGNVINGDVQLTFTIYDDEFKTTILWTEMHPSVPVADGLFSVILGEFGPLADSIFSGPIRFLGITVGADPELSQLTPLISVPYAYRSFHAEDASFAGEADLAHSVPDNSIGGNNIIDFSITGEDIADNGAISGQVLKWNGSVWAPADDNTGGGSGGWVDDGTVVRLATTTDSVGIGTASPAKRLHVVGPILSGHSNQILDSSSTIAGGDNNAADSVSVIGGGAVNAANAQYATIGGGLQNQVFKPAGTISGGQLNVIYLNGTNATIGGGSNNSAEGNSSTISGGVGNRTTSDYSSVGGGEDNYSQGGHSTVGGGYADTAWGDYSTVAGGIKNAATALYTTVAGGQENHASGNRSSIGGGYSNEASGGNSVISGGQLNEASGDQSVVSGGQDNQSSGWRSTVGGGYNDTASGDASTVSGGGNNRATGLECTISGGQNNWAYGWRSTIGGGGNNIADSTGTVGGGGDNQAIGYLCTVGGGAYNTASNWYSTISGGGNNTATGYVSVVAGGGNNAANGDYSTISGGSTNTSNGNYSIIAGGTGNSNAGEYSVILAGHQDTLTASADYSLAFGKGVYIGNAYQAMFFDGTTSGRVGINRDDRDGGISHPFQVGTNSYNGNGAYLTAGGVWADGSSIEFKDRFEKLDPESVLTKITNLRIEAWHYKNGNERHIGPVAEEFVAAFDVGAVDDSTDQRDNRYLSTVDVAGVALLAVQELERRTREIEAQHRQIESLQNDIFELREELAKLIRDN